jgi:nitrite reductase/ring-hydroxylating ferredoxin subunit
MGWTKVMDANSLSPGTRKAMNIGNRKILFINQFDEIYAVEATCPHLNLPIKRGKITEDGAIVCNFHRSKFDLKTGAVKEWCTFPPLINKAFAMMSSEKPLPVFATRVENGIICINLEE